MIYACTYCFYGKPLLGLEYKQIWKISDDNRFQFYSFSETKDGNDKVCRSYDFVLKEDVVKEIYELLLQIDQMDKKDFVEQWQLYIDEQEMTGPMSGGIYAKGINVTTCLRQLIPIENFWVFNSTDCENETMNYCME